MTLILDSIQSQTRGPSACSPSKQCSGSRIFGEGPGAIACHSKLQKTPGLQSFANCPDFGRLAVLETSQEAEEL